MKVLAAIIVLLTGCAVLLAYVAEIIDSDNPTNEIVSTKSNHQSVMGKKADALFWFVQVGSVCFQIFLYIFVKQERLQMI